MGENQGYLHYRLEGTETKLADHEKRIRFLERWIASAGGAAAILVMLWEWVKR